MRINFTLQIKQLYSAVKMNSGDFPVAVRRSEVVAAVLPVQEHWLPMSNLDLLLPPLDFGIIFCYRTTGSRADGNGSPAVAVLKKALAQALVSFYPFAGVIVENRHGEPEILCNNRGVDFTHAYADVAMEDVDLYRPDVSVDRKLVPVRLRGVLAVQVCKVVQVTELKCGGLFVGCTIDHRAADAHSANMFLKAWAKIARGESIVLLPSFRRSIFNPRRPPQPHKSIDKLYVSLLSMPPPSEGDGDRLISRIYRVSSDEIDCLQLEASYHGTSRSKIESFSAFLWKSLAEVSSGTDPSKAVKIGVVVDGRTRLSGKAASSTSLDRYFGNVLSVPYVEASVADVRSASLKRAAEAVHKCVEAAASAEHFLALVDWVEARRPKPAVVRVYCREESDEAAVVVSSGRSFPVQDLDFGWGGPEFGSYYFPWGGETGYVMPVPDARGNGDWIVYIHLKAKYLDMLEARVPHVFSPFKFNVA